MNKKDQDYINRILKKDESALTEIYHTFYGEFLAFFKKYGLNAPDSEDAFQDTVIALYQNVMRGKLNMQEGNIKTYIWAIGKHKVIDKLRKINAKQPLSIPEDEIVPFELHEHQLTKQQKLLHKHFKSLGTSCKQLLKYFYYEGLTIEEIVEISDYKDANSVKSSKSRCIKQLRNLIKSA